MGGHVYYHWRPGIVKYHGRSTNVSSFPLGSKYSKVHMLFILSKIGTGNYEKERDTLLFTYCLSNCISGSLVLTQCGVTAWVT